MLKSPLSLEQIGLRVRLDQTAEIHNGFDYQDFVTMVEKVGNKTAIGKAFGVSRKTIIRWLEVYKKEKGGSNGEGDIREADR